MRDSTTLTAPITMVEPTGIMRGRLHALLAALFLVSPARALVVSEPCLISLLSHSFKHQQHIPPRRTTIAPSATTARLHSDTTIFSATADGFAHRHHGQAPTSATAQLGPASASQQRSLKDESAVTRSVALRDFFVGFVSTTAVLTEVTRTSNRAAADQEGNGGGLGVVDDLLADCPSVRRIESEGEKGGGGRVRGGGRKREAGRHTRDTRDTRDTKSETLIPSMYVMFVAAVVVGGRTQRPQAMWRVRGGLGSSKGCEAVVEECRNSLQSRRLFYSIHININMYYHVPAGTYYALIINIDFQTTKLFLRSRTNASQQSIVGSSPQANIPDLPHYLRPHDEQFVSKR